MLKHSLSLHIFFQVFFSFERCVFFVFFYSQTMRYTHTNNNVVDFVCWLGEVLGEGRGGERERKRRKGKRGRHHHHHCWVRTRSANVRTYYYKLLIILSKKKSLLYSSVSWIYQRRYGIEMQSKVRKKKKAVAPLKINGQILVHYGDNKVLTYDLVSIHYRLDPKTGVALCTFEHAREQRISIQTISRKYRYLERASEIERFDGQSNVGVFSHRTIYTCLHPCRTRIIQTLCLSFSNSRTSHTILFKTVETH